MISFSNPDHIVLLFASAGAILFISTAFFGEWYFISSGERSRFRSLLMTAFAGGAGVFAAGNWLIFVFFLEILTLALWGMIAMKDRNASLLYLFTQLGAAGCILIGAAGMFSEHGSLAIGQVTGIWRLFFLAGLGTKAAFPLLHFWLPEVHSKAPSPASALLSGFAVNTAIFGLVRAFPEPFTLLAATGSAMALFGAFMAVFPRDIKRVLAYSTMSHLGFMTVAAGMGAPLVAAGYAFSHSLVKGMLFMSAGLIERSAGTRDAEGLRGFALKHPLTALPMIAGAFFAAGIPGTASGYAKYSVMDLMKKTYPAGASSFLAIAGMLAVGYMLNITLPLLLSKKGSGQQTGEGSVKTMGLQERRSYAASGITILAAALIMDSFFPGVLIFRGLARPVASVSFPAGSLFFSAVAGAGVFLFRSRFPGLPGEGLPDIRIGLFGNDEPLKRFKDLTEPFHPGQLNLFVFIAALFLLILMVFLHQ